VKRTPTSVIAAAIAAGALLAGMVGTSSASPQKRVRGPHQFSSPSDNIGCELARRFVRCDIMEHRWTSPPKPPDCEADYGGGLAVGAHGKGDFFCAGDTALDPAAATLHYGHTIRDGVIRCTSRATGMTCHNDRTGHGFFLSKESYRRF
jgi:hypothetical protein